MQTPGQITGLDSKGREARERKAAVIKVSPDVVLPELNYFQGELKRHQRIGIAWLYFAERGLLADTVGLGKTIHAIGLMALMKQRGELTDRAIIVMRPAALLQWHSEFARFAPRLHVGVVAGNRRQRIETYMENNDVLLIGYQMFLQDFETVIRLDPKVLIVDDVDPLRNRENKTAYAIKRLAQNASRVVIMSGTPLQTRLHELYSLLEPVGVREVFGSPTAFEKRYIRTELASIFDMRTGKKRSVKKIAGYKNMEEFKRLVEPFYLRRTHRDLDDGDMPEVVSEDVWLDLYPSQREKYKELQKGVLRIMQEEGEQVKRVAAIAKLQYGARVCAGNAALGEPDEENTSCKFDWLENELAGDLAEEKVVVFAQYKSTIRALHARLEKLGIRYVTIWGDEPDPAERRKSQMAFWNDPQTRVCIGTTAMEQSLNLQVSRILVNIDMMMNPSRMEQLMGRIRRLGSLHKTVYVFNLLTRDTQEERYLPVLEQRQALSDYVWGETSELFDQLSPLQLLQMIRP